MGLNFYAKRFIKEFPHKGWTLGSLKALICKIDKEGTVQHLPGAGRHHTVCSIENNEQFTTVVPSQEGQLQTH